MNSRKLLILATVAALPLAACVDRTTFPVFPSEATMERTPAQQLGSALANGTGVARDYAQAQATLGAAAEAGDARAMNALGVMALRARGNGPSLYDAADWFKKAADAGSAAGRYNLGLVIEARKGLFSDGQAEAMEQYRIAAEQGHALSMRRLSVLIGNADPEESRRLNELAYRRGDRIELERAAVFDNAVDRVETAIILADERCGGCGMSQERTEPRSLAELRKLAAAGDAPARYTLGVYLLQGRIVTRDPAEAVRLFRLAAKARYAPAERQLGQMYLRGEVVKRDIVLAHSWLNLAARGTGADAKSARNEMAILEGSMTADEITRAQAIANGHQAMGE